MPVPDWLVEVVRPGAAVPPWPRMLRMPLAVCVPLSAGLATGELTHALPVAMGGLVSSIVDRGGPYAGRLRRIGAATLLGSAPGLAIGLLIHGRGWITVLVITLLSVVSALMSAAGNVGSVTGLQLLVYATLGVGPLGQLRPWWPVVGLFLAGAMWGTALSLLGWTFFRHAPEERSVAEVYRAAGRALRAIGTAGFGDARQRLVAATETAYGDVCAARVLAEGSGPQDARLMALLGAARRVTAAVLALAHANARPPESVARWTDAAAEAIQTGVAPPEVPLTGAGPEADALAEALCGVRRTLTEGPSDGGPASRRRTVRERSSEFLAEVRGGRLVRRSVLRLTLCMGVAAVISEVAPFQRSYWVMLTVTVVLKPDFGSVFARAVQRGIGTVVGAVLGAAVLAVVPYGPALLLTLAVLTFLAPYAISRNWGMFATILTPIVVLLIDLLTRGGWRLAEERAIDTLAGCAIVLLLGYAPWPSSWYAHVDDEFADAVRAIARYLEVVFGPHGAGPYRRAYGTVADLRTVFQRALSEPVAVRRRATAWYPATVALERLLDTITATSAIARRRGAVPEETSVRRLVAVLDETAGAVRDGREPRVADPPRDPALVGVADAVRALQDQLSSSAPAHGSPADAPG